jgi:hypothetical protein
MTKIKPTVRAIFAAACFLIVIPLISHLLFSWMGFTPTDEGFTLAHSRRILDGQLPHRDFIIIRPFLSPLLHVPFVWWGGEYTFWLSRLFVWFQLAAISWLWVSIINRLLAWPFSVANAFLISLISFAATTHTKHLTAWHTIDGLFFIAIGLALCIRKRPATKIVGYFLIALASLCKQNFIFVAPVSLLILGDWRHFRYWIAIILPASGYALFLIFAGALPDALIQLTSHTELFSAGLRRYVNIWIALAAIGFLFWRTSRSLLSLDSHRWMGLAVFCWLPLFVAGVGLWFGVITSISFFFFGLLMMLAIHSIGSGLAIMPDTRVMLLVLPTAWSASLSGGYNTPALMAGPILVALIAHAFIRYRPENHRLLQYSIPIAAVIILLTFAVARTKYIYREQPAAALTKSLDGVMPGAKRIYTNPNTFEFLSDLNWAIKLVKAQNGEYAILPDLAAYWVKAKQQNPLPAVWPQADELSSKVLMTRFIDAMEARRANTVFIVQKVEAKDLARGFVPLPNSDYYEVVRYVRTHFTKTQETDYFELYR